MSDPDNISAIADEVMTVHEKRQRDQSILSILTNEQEETKKTLANVMKAIEQGIITPTTKSRMEELEQQLVEIEDKIQIEQYSMQNQLKREQLIEYLTHSIATNPKTLVFTLIRKIILFDNKVEIYYNYINNPDPDNSSPDDCRELYWSMGSTLKHLRAPNKKAPRGLFCLRLFGYGEKTPAVLIYFILSLPLNFIRGRWLAISKSSVTDEVKPHLLLGETSSVNFVDSFPFP